LSKDQSESFFCETVFKNKSNFFFQKTKWRERILVFHFKNYNSVGQTKAEKKLDKSLLFLKTFFSTEKGLILGERVRKISRDEER
jgi:hypothetical protein